MEDEQEKNANVNKDVIVDCITAIVKELPSIIK
jgi:hypothetical protein